LFLSIPGIQLFDKNTLFHTDMDGIFVITFKFRRHTLVITSYGTYYTLIYNLMRAFDIISDP